MLNLLIADDEAVICQGLMLMVDWEACGFFLPDVVYDGASALRRMEEKAYDVLLTDIRMPEMSGLQLAQRVQQRFAECDVIIMSGYRDFEYARMAIDCGVLRYLLKPVDEDDLAKILKELAAKKELAAESISFPKDEVFYGGRVPKASLSEKMSLLNFNQPADCVLAGNEQAAHEAIDRLILILSESCPAAYPRLWICSAMTMQLLQLVTRTGQSIEEVLGTAFDVTVSINTETLEQLQAHLHTLCSEVSAFVTRQKGRKKDGELEKIIQYLQEHCNQNLTILELGKQFFINPVYLGRKFKDYTGVGLRQYLTACRLTLAKEKLLESDQSVSAVAALAGFSDLDHFYASFKQETGMTPTQYRALFFKARES